MLEIVSGGFFALEAQRAPHLEMNKKDGKYLFLIHQCVDSNIFENIINQEMDNETFDTLKKLYGGDAKLKKVKLQSLRKQYENLQMNDDETITDSS